MQVKAVTGFVARLDGQVYRVAPGDVLTLPAGADWLIAGLVESIKDGAPENASLKAPERAVKKTSKARTAK